MFRVAAMGCAMVALLGVGSTAAAVDVGSIVAVSNNGSGLNSAPAKTGTAVTLGPTTARASQRQVMEHIGVAMAFDEGAQRLYAVLSSRAGSYLVQLDRGDLSITSVVGDVVDAQDPSIGYRPAAVGFTSDGKLYGVATVLTAVGPFPATTGVLIRIDPATGSATLVGSTGLTLYARGGAVIDDRFILLTNTQRADREVHVYDIDLESAVPQYLGGLGYESTAIGVTSDDEGTVYAVLNGGGRNALGKVLKPSRLFTLDLGSATLDAVGDTGFDLLSGLTWYAQQVGCTAWVLGDLDVGDGALVDSYYGSEGTYEQSTGSDALLCTNGDVSVWGGAILDASVYSGGESTIDASAQVGGEVGTLGEPIEHEAIDYASFVDNNDNDLLDDLCGCEGWGNDLSLKKNEQLVLPAGTYFFRTLSLAAGASIELEGDVTIVVRDQIKLADGSSINVDGEASDFHLLAPKKRVELSGAVVNGVLVAPSSDVLLTNDAEFTGAIIAGSLTVEDGAQLHLDVDLAQL